MYDFQFAQQPLYSDRLESIRQNADYTNGYFFGGLRRNWSPLLDPTKKIKLLAHPFQAFQIPGMIVFELVDVLND
jgi:hypothetical protein